MEYYIQGNAANADKIKAAFEKLGIDVLAFVFSDKTLVYCSVGGCVQCLPYSINLMNILHSHPDYQELELPIKPKFKVGDKIKAKDSRNYVFTVLSVDLQNQKYLIERDYKHQILFTKQDNFELVQPKHHYDIANFRPKQWVLVRDDDEWEWALTRFSHLSNGSASLFVCINGASFQQCIPLEGNDKLLGTTDMPSEEYINW